MNIMIHLFIAVTAPFYSYLSIFNLPFLLQMHAKIVSKTSDYFESDDKVAKPNSRLSFCYWVQVAKE